MPIVIRALSVTHEEVAVLLVALTAARSGAKPPLSAAGRRVLDNLIVQATAVESAIVDAEQGKPAAVNPRIAAITKALDATGLISKRATPNVAAAIAALPDPTTEQIATVLYMSGSKGGKQAALIAGEHVRNAIQS